MGVVFLRTIILYIVVIIAMRVMGKRQIGELQPSEFVVTILISELAAIPMQDNGIPVTNGIVPILTLIACEIFLSAFTVYSLRARKVISGTPSVLIANGVINQEEMRRLRFTIDDLMEELRLCGFMSVGEVAWAVLETNGKLSVFPTSENKPVTAGMMKLSPADGGLPETVITDGTVLQDSLKKTGHNGMWLQKQLNGVKLTIDKVFLMTVDTQGKTVIIPKAEDNPKFAQKK